MSKITRICGFVPVIGLALCLSALGYNDVTYGADWPQWRGPNRDGVCSETGLLKNWPADGPRLLWEITGLGPGYSSMAIVDGRLYTMGDISLDSEKAQCVLAYDLVTKKQIWTAKVGPIHNDGGPRCTPTVDDGLVYAIGTSGDLVCLDAKTGSIRWSRNFIKDFGGKNPGWRYSESPLIDGDKILCTPGGSDAVIVALNKKTGEVIWKCPMPDIGGKGQDEAGYSSIVLSEAAGVKQYVQLTNKGLIGVAAKDGRFLWGYNKIANSVANIPTPIVFGNFVFCSTAYNTGSAMLELTEAGDGIEAMEIYFLDARTLQNHHGGLVRIGDYIFGGHDHNKGKPICIEAKTGKVMWVVDQPGGGSSAVLYADGNLYFRYEDDTLALIKADPQNYNLISTFKLPHKPGMSGPGWSHPIIVDGRLYVRHSDVLMVYDIKAK